MNELLARIALTPGHALGALFGVVIALGAATMLSVAILAVWAKVAGRQFDS